MAKQIGSEVYLGLCQIHIMETFCETVNGLKPLTIFAKKLHQGCFLKPKIRLHGKMQVKSNKYCPLKFT